MVGIILATHGDFAKGILQSGSMILVTSQMLRLVHYSQVWDQKTSKTDGRCHCRIRKPG